MPDFDPAALSQRDRQKILTATVMPRPIALVTTLGEGGPNAAPFSYFNIVCTDPPMLMISVARRAGTPKDTVRNIEALPEFVVHVVNWATRDKMNACSAELPYGVNEIELAGFRTGPSVKVRPPRLLDCPVQYECRVAHTLKLGAKDQSLIVGEIVHMHFAQGLFDERTRRIDVERLDVIGRMEGSGMYARCTDRFDLQRPPSAPGMPSGH